MNKATITGIFLVLTACLFWGLIFVIPCFLENFSCIEVALGRYFFYGIIALFIILVQDKSFLRKINRHMWFTAFLFALVVNIIYFTSLVLGVRYANASITALLSGLGPITIAFYSNWKDKAYAYKALAIPSAMLGIGLVLVNLSAFDSPSASSISQYVLGIFFGLTSLAAWTWFVVANAKFLKQNPELSPARWANIMGLATLVWVLLIGGALALVFGNKEYWMKYTVPSEELNAFLLGTATLGLTCSWLGFYLWYRSNYLLPVSLAGQLAIFETIFGLIFIFIIESRIPSSIELIGMSIMIVGIIISVRKLETVKSAQ